MRPFAPRWYAILLLVGLSATSQIADAVPTEFTYQGKLTDGASPANASYDMQFSIWNAQTVGSGSQIAGTGTLQRPAVPVSGGVFTVTLDFGSAFATDAFLEIAVRPAGVGAYSTLNPRQKITASPYAIETLNASYLGGVPASRYVAADAGGNVGIGNGPSSLLRLNIVSVGNQSPPRAISPNTNAGFSAGWDFYHNNTGKGYVGAPDTGAFFGPGEMIVLGAPNVPLSLWGGQTRGLTVNADGSITMSKNVTANQNVTVNQNVSIGTPGTNARLSIQAGAGYFQGIYVNTESATGVQAFSGNADAIRGEANGGKGVYGSAVGGQGVRGESFNGTGVYGTSARNYSSGQAIDTAGVFGVGTGTNSIGVVGQTAVSNGVGVYGVSTQNPGYGIFARNFSGGHALYVDGKAEFIGNLIKPAGSFRIDHPLDPENKYLSHSFVESPDMMNVYNGNITTDASGLAIVTLPEWFDALNRDFRYQLTVIGVFAQAIVAEEIHDNRFAIATSAPKVKVSWQVTGIRRDAYAEQNRIPVEELKPEEKRGLYLHPSAFGQSAELAESNRNRR